MSAYLSYSYSSVVRKEEQIKIDEKTKKAQEEFTKGFAKGANFSLAAYSLFSVATSAACAADSNVPVKKPPADTGANQPVPAPKTISKTGLNPLSEGPKGVFIGGVSVIYGAASQSGDFALSLACAFLLVIGGIVINRP